MAVNDSSGRMFPEKDVSCIWVDAGLISYKLCDRNFGCDECPFDMVMRQKSGPASVTNQIEKIEPDKVLPEERPIAKYESVTDLLNGFLAAPSSVLLPGDRMYSRSHTWLREIRTGVFRIGVDHYAAHFIEHLSGLAVQQVGTSLKAGDPLAWVTSDGGTVALLSPLSGRIVNTNSVVRDSPHAAAANPYDQGWVTEIAVIGVNELPDDLLNASKALLLYELRSRELREEIAGRLDRGSASIGKTLADGGFHPLSMKDMLGPQEYLRFLRELLSSRS